LKWHKLRIIHILYEVINWLLPYVSRKKERKKKRRERDRQTDRQMGEWVGGWVGR
jgi:hypothetical protein